MQRETAGLLSAIFFLAAFLATASASAQSNPNDPTFGSRSDKPDGSVALTIGRRLPTDWDTKFGMDAKLSPEPPSAMADTVLVNPSVTRSTGAVWGSMTGPGVAPLLFDKTAVDARIDPSDELIVVQDRHREVAVLPLLGRDVDLDEVAHPEERQSARTVADQRVER